MYNYQPASRYFIDLGNIQFGTKIFTLSPRVLNPELQSKISQKAEEITDLLYRDYMKNNEEDKAKAKIERENLLKAFEGRCIFVEEIPNEYCNRPCCINRPWFKVTTTIGVLKIGWRKRVIVLDWEKTILNKKSEELFNSPNRQGDYWIDSFSYEEFYFNVNKLFEAKA